LDDILKIDDLAIDALLLAKVQCQNPALSHVQEVQPLLNLLQTVCILSKWLYLTLMYLLEQRLSFPLHPFLKNLHTRALIKLSQTSGLYPKSMVLKGVNFVGRSALDRGSYGDIWKASLGGQDICVKVLRVYQTTDKTKLLKVGKIQNLSNEASIKRQSRHSL
jgi:hypothetical protein